MPARRVPLLIVALVVWTGLVRTGSLEAGEPAAKLRAPVPVADVARGASPAEERQDRYRRMKERAGEYDDRPPTWRNDSNSRRDEDERPIRRVSQEELWDYLDGPRDRPVTRTRRDRDVYERDRDPLLPDRKSSSATRAISTRRDRDRYEDDYDHDRRSSGRIGDRMLDWMDFEKPRGWLESDRCFESMISPVSSPFLFEDPRALTEIRPLFIYQKIPSPQQDFKGGNIWFLGTQVRFAFTERISMTINKLGATAVNPSGDSLFGDNFGFSELWLGPKFTIIRDEEFGTLLAAGATFQIPVGQAKVFQDTGRLSIVPYVSLAQPFLKTRLGTFNGLVNTGYSASTDRQRSDFYYLNAHTSFDLGNAQRFFPLAELNWTHYTTNGTTLPVIGEGRDLINFGSMSKGTSLLTGALGARFRVTKSAEIGAAFELPLAGNKDFFGHRFTLDFIWRY